MLPITYQNGNISVTLDKDGTKTLEYDGELKPKFPISLDFKITQFCDGAFCEFCHEKSTPKGNHSDLGKAISWFKSMPCGSEVACLDRDSRVATPFGLSRIIDINVGDYVIGSNCKSQVVTNKVISKRGCVEVKFSRGTSVICTPDHVFVTEDGVEVQAKNLLGKRIKSSYSEYIPWKSDTLDMTPFEYVPSCKKVAERVERDSVFSSDNFIRLSRKSPFVDRKIQLSEDIMWLYGITVSEGSRKTLSFGYFDYDVINASKSVAIYEKLLKDLSIRLDNGREKRSSIIRRKNAIVVTPVESNCFETIFFEAMKINHHARNKSISFLFGLEKNLIKAAIRGLIDGDGCKRKRLHSNGKYHHSLSFKTSSDMLAKELVFLLKFVFDIDCSYYEGMNKERKIEGRTLAPSNYFKIDIYGAENIYKLYPEDYPEFNGVKNVNYQKGIEVLSVTEVGEREVVDISIGESEDRLFSMWNGYLTHNCGGGDPLSHPDLIWFLKELKSLGMVPNLTINQKHLQMRKDVIDQILKEDLVYGLGLSFWKIDDELKEFCKEKKDLIIHLISGIHPVSVIDEIKEFHNKVLVLGYKDYGFGKAHKVKHSAEVSQSLEQWSWGIGSCLKDIQISFDNLAVDQLDMKRFFNANMWQERFLGEDGTLTFYIDAVKQQWAKNSTSPDRFTMEGETIETAFRKLIS